jgi:predicted glycosyltransferase
MRILFGISHPKHVYLFKNVILNLIKRGHKVKIVAVEKEITGYLLNAFNLPFTIIGDNQPNLVKKALSLPKLEYQTYKIAKEFRPNIFVGRAIPHLAHVSTLLNKPFLIFEDTEIAKTVHKITLPFANAVVTPLCYQNNLGDKQIRFDGYFELEYLHPNYFNPEIAILEQLGIAKKEKFAVIRLVSWNATHDVGDGGFGDVNQIIKAIEGRAKVFISSEYELPKGLKEYKIDLPPEMIHHLLFFSDLYIGESATMAAESAILGTPSIFVSTSRRGYTDELEDKYGLIFSFSDKDRQNNSINKALEILENSNSKKEWQSKSRRMFEEKIDVAKFMTNFIEGWPMSFKESKQNSF